MACELGLQASINPSIHSLLIDIAFFIWYIAHDIQNCLSTSIFILV